MVTTEPAIQIDNEEQMIMSPNFGESALLTAGDEGGKTVDFFSATRSNNDLKDMLEDR